MTGEAQDMQKFVGETIRKKEKEGKARRLQRKTNQEAVDEHLGEDAERSRAFSLFSVQGEEQRLRVSRLSAEEEKKERRRRAGSRK